MMEMPFPPQKIENIEAQVGHSVCPTGAPRTCKHNSTTRGCPPCRHGAYSSTYSQYSAPTQEKVVMLEVPLTPKKIENIEAQLGHFVCPT